MVRGPELGRRPRLPFICLVQNNVYAISVPTEEADGRAQRGRPRRRLWHARRGGRRQRRAGGLCGDEDGRRPRHAGEGPTLVEAKTYRVRPALLRRRRPLLPSPRRGRAVEEARPHPAVRALPGASAMTDADARLDAADIRREVDRQIDEAWSAARLRPGRRQAPPVRRGRDGWREKNVVTERSATRWTRRWRATSASSSSARTSASARRRLPRHRRACSTSSARSA